ncbi:MAG: PAS domain S-box protein, partial [Chitinophagaceae bacterium]|nr:PAS domain S-box protein [Chitinophagaceae bacterium]
MKIDNHKVFAASHEAGIIFSDDELGNLPPQLADQLSDALVFTDERFTVTLWNKAASRLLGLPANMMVGSTLHQIMPGLHPLSKENIYSSLIASGKWKGETVIELSEEQTIQIELSVFTFSTSKPGYAAIIRPSSAEPVQISNIKELIYNKPFFNALAEGLIVQDDKGEIIVYNTVAESITGLTREQIIDKDFLESERSYFTESGDPFSWDNFPAIIARRSGLPQTNVVIGWLHSDGFWRWININSHPVIEDSGRLIGTVTSFTDITAIKAAQQDLKNSEERWRAVMNNGKSGIVLIDPQYNVVLANDIAIAHQQLMPGHIVIKPGMSFLDLLPEHRREPVKETLQSVLRGDAVEYEIVYTKSDNQEVWLLANYTPVKGVDGKITGICFSANDITAIKANEFALFKSEQRWKFALDGAGDGVWEYNFQTKESYYSPIYKNMLGFSDKEFQNEAYEWHTRIHPEDVDKVKGIDQLYENRAIEHHAVEYRLRGKSGEYVWILDRGMMLERTADGEPLKLIGTHKNITEQKNREEALIQSRKRFGSFMANTPTMTWIIDENAVFRYLNAPYMKAFNLHEDDIGKSIYDIFPKHICDLFVENNWKVWNSNKSIETIEEGVGPNGDPQLYQIFKFPLETEDGVRVLGGVALDITQKVILEKRLAEEQETKKREIIQAIMSAQEKERKELAYELHDNVNQILSSSRLMLEVAIEKPDISQEFMNRSLVYLQNAITELRKISHSLIPGTLRDISLEAAIEEVVQNINATEKLSIVYEKRIGNNVKMIAPEIQLAVLRIVQEQCN